MKPGLLPASVSPLRYFRQQDPPKPRWHPGLGHPSTPPAPPEFAVLSPGQLTASASGQSQGVVSSTDDPSCPPGCSQQGQCPSCPSSLRAGTRSAGPGNWTAAAPSCAGLGLGQPGSLSTQGILITLLALPQHHRKLQEHTVHGGEGRKLDHPFQLHCRHTTAHESHKPETPLVFQLPKHCSSTAQENLSYSKKFALCRGESSRKRGPLSHLPQRPPLGQIQS